MTWHSQAAGAARRRRLLGHNLPGHPQPLRPVCWCAALLSSAVLAGCGSSPHSIAPSLTSPSITASSPASPAGSPQPAGSAAPGLSDVFRRPLLNPRVTVTHGVFLVAWEVSPPGEAPIRSELARFDAATGRIEATQNVTGVVGQVLDASGSLWCVTETGSMPAAETLLQLNPATLRVIRQRRIGTGGEFAWAAQTLVVAGRWLWVAGGNRLLRVWPRTGGVTVSIVLPRAASSDVSANSAGTTLIVGEADEEGRGAVQRRDPATGALLASHAVEGVAAPTVAGPVGSAVWISEATGMMGYVQRLGSASMRPDGSICAEGRITATCVPGTNGITARVADGLLWITQVAGGSQRNYCARPVSGRAIAPVVLPRPSQDIVLGIASDRIFYAAPGPRAGQYLRQLPIPAGCRAH
jgi:hypothetical protein